MSIISLVGKVAVCLPFLFFPIHGCQVNTVHADFHLGCISVQS